MHSGIKLGVAATIIAAVVVTSTPYFGFSRGEGCDLNTNPSNVLRIGYFPNINHAQAVIGLGGGDFQRALDGIEVMPQLFTAGPSVIDALRANQIDVAYVGPNPAINEYVESAGCHPRVIAGAASGGAVFVVRSDAGIDSPDDFKDKRFASPQLGNTQDVALRKYLAENGYTVDKDVKVIPMKTAEILTLLQKKDIDGAWVAEPWGARLVKEANATIFLDERERWPPNGEFVSAHIVVRTDYLQNNPETIRKLLQAHIDKTLWINENPEDAMHAFNAGLEELTRKTIPEDELKSGFSRMDLTWDPLQESLFQSAKDAFDIGFLRNEEPDLSQIYDLSLLNEVLEENGLTTIQ